LGKGRAVDLSAVASATPGLSGAELEFIVNEAAIRAVRRVSAELQQGMDPAKIVPTVEAIDFEESVKNFFQTRRTKGGVSDLLRSLQK
jgi:SpoVK/Ycf46/Vps4 family AAA+-type ATPase